MSQIHILDGQSNQGEILDYITPKDIIEDNHKKNKENTLEIYNFITFADRRFSAFLEKRNRIIIPDEDHKLREFVISEAHKYKDSEGHKAQVFAHASYLELKKASILNPSTFEGTVSQHGGRVLNDTGWQIGIVEGKGTRKLTIENHTNPYEMLKRIAKEFELELRFRVEHNGNKITGRYVDLLERVGEWRGREVEFGKDLAGIRRVEKQDIVTALLGLGPEDEDGNRLEVLVEDEEALQRWGRVDEHGKLHHLIEPYEIQSTRTEMTETEARQYTRTALNKRINTQVTYEGSIVDLENVPGMQNKKIRFGDTIRIKDTTFNPPLYLEARIFEQTRSIKSKAKKDFRLGDYIEYTEEEVNAIWQQLQKDIRNRVSRYEMMEYTYDKLTIDDKDETVFQDGKTFAEATGIKAEENAKDFAVEQDAKIKVDVEEYADTVSEQQAESALSQAKQYAVAKTVYDNQMIQIASDIEDRAPLEYVDGKFTVVENDLEKFNAEIEKKADGSTVYTIAQVDNMINNTVSKTQYTTDMDGIVTDLDSHGTRIGQNEKAIGLKADSSELDAIESSLTTKIGNVEVKADGVITSVSEVRADLDGLEIGGRNYQVNTSDDYRTKEWDSWNEYIRDREGNYYRITVEPNTEYTVSVYYKDVNTPDGARVGVRIFWTLQDGSRVESSNGQKAVENGEEGYAVGTFKSPPNVRDALFVLRKYSSAGGASAKYKDAMFVKGDRRKEWSPAPEDIDESINQVSGRVETLDASVETLAGEVSLKASQSVVDSLENRVSTAEGEISVLPGQISLKADASDVYSKGQVDATFDAVNAQINMKVDDGEARSIFLQEANSFTFDASQVNFTGHVFGKDATFEGKIEGAEIIGGSIVGAEILSQDSEGRTTYISGGQINARERDTSSDSLLHNTYYSPSGISSDSARLNPFEFNLSVAKFREDLITKNLEVESFASPLWEGEGYPTDTQTITPTKNLSDCTTGWLFRWQRYVKGSGLNVSQYQYTFVSKTHTSGRGLRMFLKSSATTEVNKYLYIYNDRIEGHSTNSADDNHNLALTGVFEF